MVFLACSLIALIGCSVAFKQREFDCRGKDGQVWWGCGSFGVCTGGRHVQQDCLDGTRYDRRSQSCVNANQAAFPCNTNADCSNYYGEGHRFVERGSDPVENLPSCSFYYTCAYGRFLGHQQCNDGTVFDESSQLCKTADQVPPPCGNYTGPTERPPFSQVRQTISNRFPNNNNNRINNNNNNRFPNNNNNNGFNNNQNNNRFPNNNNNNGRILPATQRPSTGNELYGRKYPYRNLFRGTNRYSTYNNGRYNNGNYYNPRRFNPSLFGVAVDEFNQGATSQELELESED